MMQRLAKVSEIADRFRVSVDAVYLWIRQGKIPADCVVRIAGTVRVDEKQFEQRLRSGALCQPRGRKRPAPDEPRNDKPWAFTMAEDNFTTTGQGPAVEHRWTSDTGGVQPEHPYSPEMVATAK
jgi:transposase-like protein